MRIKEGFILREVSGMHIVMPVGRNVKNFKGAVMLNDSGALLFKRLQNGCEKTDDLVNALTDVYSVDVQTARADAEKIVSSFLEMGILE